VRAHERPDIYRLLAHGADINSRDDNGQTPLHKARQREVAGILIKHPADFSVQDNDRSKPWDIAKKRDYEQLLTLLAEHGGHGQRPLRNIVLPVLASGLVTYILLITVLRLLKKNEA
jgi:ankyrin repeat protein